MAEILRIVGTVAGIGGISLGIILIIFRDFLKDFIKAKVFTTLTSTQATILIGATIVFTFSIAIIGLFSGFVKDGGSISFIVLVAVILLFILAIVYIFSKQSIPARDHDNDNNQNVFQKVYRLLGNSKFNEAERELSKASSLQRNSAEFWYWKSMIAFKIDNAKVASSYLDEALRIEPRHAFSLALKIKLLLLSGKRGDWSKAKELAEKSMGISNDLDIWINCLKAANMFSPGPKTNFEIDKMCAFPKQD